MPELPDIELYLHALRPRVVGRSIGRIRVPGPFLVRTVDPPIDACEGKGVRAVRRLGKRIVLELESDLFLVIHLMIAGRLRWLEPWAKPLGKIAQATLVFPDGTLALTEAGTKHRASIHVLSGEASLRTLDRGGMELLDERASLARFAQALRRESHTIKRTLTDPRLISGIGTAYSDEILHAAGMSPLLLTSRMDDEQIARVYEAARRVLTEWTARLRLEFAGTFPGAGEVTAFRPDFAVHGKFGKPCLVCGTKVQRIAYAENETNYCPRCQTGGKVLADRSLSRLLREDWPRTIEELEEQQTQRRGGDAP